MRPYKPTLAGVTAGFPGAIYTPRPRLDRRNDHPKVTETGLVPLAEDSHTVELDYAILQQVVFSVTDLTAGAPLNPVPWAQAPAADEVAVKYDAGLLRFHSSLGQPGSQHEIQVVYHPLGSVESASYGNTLQVELAAVQQAVAGLPSAIPVTGRAFIPGVPAQHSERPLAIITLPAVGREELTVKRTVVFANDLSVLNENQVLSVIVTTANAFEDITVDNRVYLTLDAGLQQYLTESTSELQVPVTDGSGRIYVFCGDNGGGHGNVTVEVIAE